MNYSRRKIKPLKNGRDRDKASGKFSQVSYEMQTSPAFQSLSASAIRVLLWAIFENFRAGTAKGAVGKPQFKMTNSDAQKYYGLSSQTFSRAKNELSEKGFLEWATRGGLKGCNGVCSTYYLSGEWKKWTPPLKTVNQNLERARAILEEKRKAIGHGKNLKSVKPA